MLVFGMGVCLISVSGYKTIQREGSLVAECSFFEQFEKGGWRLVTGGWQLAASDWQNAFRKEKIAIKDALI